MKIKVFISLLLFLTSILFSQEMKLYAPFPSRIKAEKSGTEIVVTWKDSKDVINGSYEIYRAGVALTAENLYQAEKIGDVEVGVQIYSDTPPLGTDLYYAIFAKDPSQVYKICIPYRNVTTVAVKVDKSDIEEAISTVITGIEATVYNTEVNLKYSSSLEDRQIILFRSTSIIDSYEELLKSIVITESSGTLQDYTDTPLAGIKYYYAAVDGELYRSGSKNIIYDGNFTNEGVLVKFSHELEDDVRYSKGAMPLPLLKMNTDLESGEHLHQLKSPESTENISRENLQSIKELIQKSLQADTPLEPAVLSYNKKINSIISVYFLQKSWSETISRLENYTSRSFDEDTRIQSHFYRGQSYFFLGMYNEAMVEFIMIEKDLYVETAPFFEAIYNIIKIN